MTNTSRTKKGGKKLAKGVKGLVGGVNPKGFVGNKEAKKLKREGNAVGRKSASKAKKMGF